MDLKTVASQILYEKLDRIRQHQSLGLLDHAKLGCEGFYAELRTFHDRHHLDNEDYTSFRTLLCNELRALNFSI